DEINGYWISRKNYFLGRFLMKGGQFPDYTMRLYRRGKGRLSHKDVHEQAEIVGKVGYLKESLLHYPYKSFNFYLTKWDRYNDFISDKIREDLKNKNKFKKVMVAPDHLLVKPLFWFVV